MTDTVDENTETATPPLKPRRSLKKRLIITGISLPLLLILLLVILFQFAEPRVITSPQSLTRNTNGKFEFEYEGGALGAWNPTLSFINEQLDYDLTSIETRNYDPSIKLKENLPARSLISNCNIWIINHSDHLLAQRLATNFLESMNDTRFSEISDFEVTSSQVEYFPAGTSPPAGSLKPSLLLELNLENLKPGKPDEFHQLSGDVFIRFSSKFVQTPMPWDSEHPYSGFDNRFGLHFDYQTDGFISVGARYESLAQSISFALMKKIGELNSYSRNNEKQLIDASRFYPAFQPAPKFEFLTTCQAFPHLSCRGYQKANETVWSFRATPEEYAQLKQQVSTELSAQNWQSSNTNEILKFYRGNDSLRILKENENYSLDEFVKLYPSPPPNIETFNGYMEMDNTIFENNDNVTFTRRRFLFELGNFFKMQHTPAHQRFERSLKHSPHKKNPFFFNSQEESNRGSSSGGGDQLPIDMDYFTEGRDRLLTLNNPQFPSTPKIEQETYLILYQDRMEPEEIQPIVQEMFDKSAAPEFLLAYQEHWTPTQITQFLRLLDQQEKKTIEDWKNYTLIRKSKDFLDAEKAQDAAKRTFYLSLADPVNNLNGLIDTHPTSIFEITGGKFDEYDLESEKELMQECGMQFCKLEDFPIEVKLELDQSYAIAFINEAGQPQYESWTLDKIPGILKTYHFYRKEFNTLQRAGSQRSSRTINSFPYEVKGGTGFSQVSFNSHCSVIIEKTDDPEIFNLTLDRAVKILKQDPNAPIPLPEIPNPKKTLSEDPSS